MHVQNLLKQYDNFCDEQTKIKIVIRWKSLNFIIYFIFIYL